jgi:hypothetical protein
MQSDTLRLSPTYSDLMGITDFDFSFFDPPGGRRGLGPIICFAAGNQDVHTYLSPEENKGGQVYYGPILRGINLRNSEVHVG